MKKIILAGLVTGTLVCCHKTPGTDQLTGNFVVITNRDKAAMFNDYKNFAISDTVTLISNVPTDDSLLLGDPGQVLINTVKNNLKSNGYLEVSRFSHPDLGIKLTVIKQVDKGIVYPPGWWWGYPGYPGFCYWDWCYPGYYPYPVAYSYHVGDLIIEVFDLKNAAVNHDLRVIWIANTGGVLSSITQENIDKAIVGIDQAFAQSPYFKTN